MIVKASQMKLCPSWGSIHKFKINQDLGVSICEECGREMTSVALTEVSEEIDDVFFSKRICLACGKDITDDLLIDGESIVVFKCSSCGQLEGYRVVPVDFSDRDGVFDETYFSNKALALAKSEGHSVYTTKTSEKIAKAIRESQKNPENVCQNELKRLVKQKSRVLLEIGAYSGTIEIANQKASSFVVRDGPFTKKQVGCLFSGALLFVQEYLSLKGLFTGKVITERQAEEVFDIDRKTIRKWTRIVKEKNPN